MKKSIEDFIREYHRFYINLNKKKYASTFTHSGEIERDISILASCKASTVGRTLRRMAEAGELEREERYTLFTHRKTVYYRMRTQKKLQTWRL